MFILLVFWFIFRWFITVINNSHFRNWFFDMLVLSILFVLAFISHACHNLTHAFKDKFPIHESFRCFTQLCRINLKHVHKGFVCCIHWFDCLHIHFFDAPKHSCEHVL